MDQIANDWSPPRPRELSALETAYRALSWTTDRINERAGLSKAQREAKAKEYDARAASWAAYAAEHPGMLEMAGFCTTAARIMRASD